MTFSFIRAELASKDLYVVAIATSTDADVTFETIRVDIPPTIPDNSKIARISILVIITAASIIVFI